MNAISQSRLTPGPGPIQGRDGFAAFLCDEASLDVLRPLIAELGWEPDKCTRGGLRGAVQSLSVTSSPNILMVDLSESGDPLSDINGLAEVCEPGTVVIAVGQVNDVRLYRDLLASGIHDYLLKPLSSGHVRETLEHAQAIFSAPRHQDGAAQRHAVVAVVGMRGGCGASTVATSLAWLFSTEQKLTTALLDLDIYFGTGALTLDLEPGRGLTDAIENPGRIDGLFIQRAMIKASDQLSILSSEASISAPMVTDGAAFGQLEDELRAAFDMTVIDLPRAMLIHFPHLLSQVNVVILVSELTLAGARDTIRVLSWLNAQAPQAHPVVVASKVQSGSCELSRSDFEASIEHKIDFALGYEFKSATNAAKLGQTFAQANPATATGVELSALAAHVHDIGKAEDGQPAPPPPSKKTLLGKIDIKAMLTRKTKTAAAA